MSIYCVTFVAFSLQKLKNLKLISMLPMNQALPDQASCYSNIVPIIITHDLSNHESNIHAAKNAQQSHSCEETFETTRKHPIHTKTHHGQLLSQHCHLCDIAFETCDQLKNHIDIVHAPCLEPIPQYDHTVHKVSKHKIP